MKHTIIYKNHALSTVDKTTVEAKSEEEAISQFENSHQSFCEVKKINDKEVVNLPAKQRTI